jgi:hypothetical protein
MRDSGYSEDILLKNFIGKIQNISDFYILKLY